MSLASTALLFAGAAAPWIWVHYAAGPTGGPALPEPDRSAALGPPVPATRRPAPSSSSVIPPAQTGRSAAIPTVTPLTVPEPGDPPNREATEPATLARLEYARVTPTIDPVRVQTETLAPGPKVAKADPQIAKLLPAKPAALLPPVLTATVAPDRVQRAWSPVIAHRAPAGPVVAVTRVPAVEMRKPIDHSAADQTASITGLPKLPRSKIIVGAVVGPLSHKTRSIGAQGVARVPPVPSAPSASWTLPSVIAPTN